MSNKQETKEQEVVIIEGNDTTVTEEKKVNFDKGTYTKVKEGFRKNKKTIISVAAGVAVGLGVGLLGSDFGKKNGLQKEGQQDYIEGEFEEVEEIESTDEGSYDPEELEQLTQEELEQLEGN